MPIRENLKLVKKRFENPVYKAGRLIGKGMFRGEDRKENKEEESL